MAEIIISQKKHLLSIAKCQINCFPNSFAVKLGEKCVEKTLHWYFESDNRLLLHLEEDGKIVGFCGGIIPQFISDGGKSGMLRYVFKDVCLTIIKKPWLIFENSFRQYVPHFAKNILLRFRKKYSINKPTRVENEYLQSLAMCIIAVSPQHQNKGYAQILMQYVADYAALHNRRALILSVKQHNIPAIRSYQKFGFVVTGKAENTLEMVKGIA